MPSTMPAPMPRNLRGPSHLCVGASGLGGAGESAGLTLPCPTPCLLASPQVDATVKSWNVKILGLNRQSRHRDLTVAQASRAGPPAVWPAARLAAPPHGSGAMQTLL